MRRSFRATAVLSVPCLLNAICLALMLTVLGAGRAYAGHYAFTSVSGGTPSPPPVPFVTSYTGNQYQYGGSANAGNAPASAQGTVTFTFTWQPDYTGEPAPRQVMVTKHGKATASGGYTVANPGRPTLTADAGVGASATPVYQYQVSNMYNPTGAQDICTSEGYETKLKTGGVTVTVSFSPSAMATPGSSGGSAFASVTTDVSIAIPAVDTGRHNWGWVDGVLKWLGSDPSYTRWMPLAFSPQVSSQPFHPTNSASLPQPWGNMNCIYGIHVEKEAHQDLTGGGVYFVSQILAGAPPVGTPLLSAAFGVTSFDTVIVDTNGDRIHVNNPAPASGPPPTAQSVLAGHTDVFSRVLGLNTGSSTSITLENAGPPGSMKQKGSYKYVFVNTQLSSIEDTFGNKQTFTYGSSPYLTISDLTSGRQLFFYMGTGGYIDRVVAPYFGSSTPAVTTRLAYDSTGHMTASRVYFQGGTTSPVHEDLYTYSGDQLVSSSNGGDLQTSTFISAPSKDAFGFDIWRVASATYGSSGDTTSSDDGYGVDGTFGYSYTNEMATNGEVAGHTTSFTDARGAGSKQTAWYSSIYDATNTGYFKMSDLILPPFVGAIDPATSNPSTEAAYRTVYQPNINNPTTVTEIDPLGKLWKMTLDGSKQPLTIVDPLFNTTTLTWGGASGADLLSLTDPTNLSWAFEYTPTGGRVTKVTDPSNTVVSTATYNSYGQLATETVPSSVSSSGQAETTTYTYDGTTGDLMQLTGPHGVKSVVGVLNPATHALVPGTSYDPLGDPLALSVFPDTGDPATSATPLTTQLMWSASQDLTGAILPNGLRLVNTFTNGRRTKVQTFDPYNTLLGEANLSYDTRGRLYEISDLVGTVAKYRYDKNSNVTQVIDGRGNSSYVQYGQNNEPTGTSSDGSYGTDSVLYDAAGRVRESTDRRGVVFQFAYDTAGKLTGVTIPSQTGDNAAYYYDAAGRPLSVTRANGDSIVYAYTGANKWLTSVTTTVGSRVHVVSYTYNGDGKRSSMTSTVTGGHSRTTTYQWNKAGWLISESTTGFGTTSWIYDFTGRMVSQTTVTPSSNTIGTVYTWGTSGLSGDPSTAPVYLSRITHKANGVETIHWDLAYSLLGQVREVLGTRANGDTSADSYTYDGRGRLTGESRSHTVGSNSYSGTNSYTYDLADNLNAGGNGWSYDADNHVTSAPAVGGAPGATGLSYDAAGNLTGVDGKTLSYDALGHLVSVSIGSVAATLTYDPVGRRFSKTDPGGTVTYYDYDGGTLIGEQVVTGSGSTYTDFIVAIGAVVGSTPEYHQFDPNGYLDETLSASGSVTGYMQRRVDMLGDSAEGPSGSGQLTGALGTTGRGTLQDSGLGRVLSFFNGGQSIAPMQLSGDPDAVPISENGRPTYYDPYNHAVQGLAGAGKMALSAAAGSNPICNALTLLQGQNADGSRATKLDKGLAGLGLAGGAMGMLGHDAEIMGAGGAFHSPGDVGGVPKGISEIKGPRSILPGNGKVFLQHVKDHGQLVQRNLGAKIRKLGEGGPEDLIDALNDALRNGDLKYEGWKSIAKGQPGYMYRGKGLIVWQRPNGELWTVIKEGTGGKGSSAIFDGDPTVWR